MSEISKRRLQSDKEESEKTEETLSTDNLRNEPEDLNVINLERSGRPPLDDSTRNTGKPKKGGGSR